MSTTYGERSQRQCFKTWTTNTILLIIVLAFTSFLNVANCNDGCVMTQITSNSGTFKSVNFPSNYVNNINCQFHFRNSVNNSRVKITFTSFCLEISAACKYDSLKIDSNKYCSCDDALNHQTFIRKTPFSMQFVTDYRDVYHGFNGTYEYMSPSTSETCDGFTDKISGILQAPQVTNLHLNCQFLFDWNPFHINNVDLKFTKFNLPTTSVTAFNSTGVNIPLDLEVDKRVNYKLPLSLHINAVTDSNSFKIKYSYPHGCVMTPVTSNSGTFNSINFPSNYDGNINCQFLFRNSIANSRVNITFTSFCLESGTACNYDYLNISGTKYCACNDMLIHQTIIRKMPFSMEFVTDNEDNFKGFNGTYEYVSPTTPETCNGFTNKVRGILQAPQVTNFHMNCQFLFEGMPNHGNDVYLEFTKFNLPINSVTAFNSTGVDIPLDLETNKTVNYKLPFSLHINAVTDSNSFQIRYSYRHGCVMTQVTSNSGTFNSVNFPNKYINNINCEFYFRNSVHNSRVKITFTSFCLESSAPCKYDSLKIDSTKYCSCDDALNQKTFIRKTPFSMQFVTDDRDVFNGFNGTYEYMSPSTSESCVMTQVTSNSGTFNSVNFPSNYINNINCQFHFRNSVNNSRVKITFTSFCLESGTACRYDSLKIDSTKYCSCYNELNHQTFIRKTPFSMLFVTDNDSNKSGFKGTYEYISPSTPETCDGLTNKESGILQAPQVTNFHMNCQFLFEGRSDNKHHVKLYFTNFNIPKNSVTALNSTGVDIPLDLAANKTVYFKLPFSLHIKAVIDSNAFNIKYTYVQVCDTTQVTSDSGMFKSTNFPNNYNNNINCEFLFRNSIANSRVKITFTSFCLESATSCKYDSLEISGTKYCGCDNTLNYQTFIRKTPFSMHFVTDGQDVFKGFNGTYEYMGPSTPETCNNITNKVSGILQAPQVTNFHMNCQFLFEGTLNHRNDVDLEFTKFNLPINSVTAFNSTGFAVPFDVEVNKTVNYKLPFSLHINAVTDSNSFQIRYSYVQGCVMTRDTSNSGTFKSANFPNNYVNNINCQFNFSNSIVNSRVKITFINFCLESSTDCKYDSLKLSGTKYCGCNNMLIHQTFIRKTPFSMYFVTDNRDTHKGFNGTYEYINPSTPETCDGFTNKESGILQAPQVTNFHMNCQFLFEVRSDNKHHVELDFTNFNIPKNSVTALNSTGVDIPLDLATNKTVDFKLPFSLHINAVIDSNSFKIRYTYVHVCDMTKVTDNSGTFKSVNFPRNYDDSINCQFYFDNSIANSRVKITFTSFCLESATACKYDYLKISGTKYCGCNKMMKYQIFIRKTPFSMLFVTDNQDNFKGFNGTYEYLSPSTLETCDGFTNKESGILKAPQVINFHMNCQFLFEEKPNHKNIVRLYFTTFNLPENSVTAFNSTGSDIPLDVAENKAVFYKLPFSLHINAVIDTNSFEIKYTYMQACKPKELTSTSGLLQSPGYPNNYYNDYNCYFNIKNDKYRYVEIYFEEFSLATSSNCTADRLTIGHVPYCGEELKGQKFIVKTPLKIQFETDSSGTHPGFKATYTFINSPSLKTCETLPIRQDGYISAPDMHDDPMDCTYWFAGVPGYNNTVKLQLQIFRLPINSMRALNASGADISSDILTKNIGVYRLPISIHFDATVKADSFKFKYSYHKNCDMTVLSSDSGILQSPDYGPSNTYHNNEHCDITIPENDNRSIEIYFEEFSLEKSRYCFSDKLIIGEIPYCGDDLKGRKFIRKAPLYLTFITDSSDTFKGFKATYKYTNSSSPDTCNELTDKQNGFITSADIHGTKHMDCQYMFAELPAYSSSVKLLFTEYNLPKHSVMALNSSGQDVLFDVPTNKAGFYMLPFSLHFLANIQNNSFNFTYSYLPGCQMITALSSDSGFLQTPGYPSNYSNDAHCGYNFENDNYRYVEINFNQFSLAKSVYCENDKVIIDGTSYCGNDLKNQKIVHSLPLLINFLTDHVHTSTGFHATYKYTNTGLPNCEMKVLSASSGILQSPNYPNNYTDNYYCQINIPDNNYQFVEIYFEQFSLEKSEDCKEDKLLMDQISYCGEDLKGQRIVRPLPFDITFLTSHKLASKGFYATYKYTNSGPQTCVSLTNQLQGSVDLSALKNVKDSECVYKFPKKDGYNRIKIDFGTTTNLTSGYLDIYTSNNAKQRFNFAQLSDKTEYYYLPLKIVLTKQTTDFKMNYKYLSGCNVQVEGTDTVYTSPQYPLNYYDHAGCIFEIPIKKGFCGVTVTFTDFSIEDSENCKNDALAVGDGGTYCGEDLKYKSVTLFLPTSLNFSTNDQTTGKGFKAVYSYIQTCEQVYDHSLTVQKALVLSPNYPEKYPNNIVSAHKFSKQHNSNLSKIEIKFLKLDIENSTDCKNDGLTIGEDVYCGNQLKDKTVTYSLPVTLKFHTNHYGRYNGFLLSYTYIMDESHTKEILLNDSKGSFGSYGYEKHIESNFKYKYVFSDKVGFCALRLSFKYFHLRKYLNCKHESVRFLNNTYCGDQLMNEKVMVQNLPFSIIYETNIEARGGFYAEYEYIDQCDQKKGIVITSPGYPLYEANTNSTYNFAMRSGYCGVQLTFDDFALQYSPKCSADALNINGIPYCGDELASKTVSFSLPVTMTFTSDQYVNNRGFVMQYKYIKDCTTLCNKNYYGIEGYITPSLIVDDSLQNDVYCSFVINRYELASCVKISFQMLDICENDGYIIIDGKEYCGQRSGQQSIVKTMFGKNNAVVIGWKSPAKNVKNESFTMIYTQLMNNEQCITRCDFESTPEVTTGFIQSPSYPANYQENQDCTYNFLGYSDFCGVELNFKSFDLQTSTRCSSDRLDFDHKSYCGQQLLNTKVTKFLPLKLTFSSDNKVNGNGFYANYKYIKDCGGVCQEYLHSKIGFITPREGLFGMHMKENCEYNIYRISGAKSVTFSILQLDLCNLYQYIQIDGQKYCQISDGNTIKVTKKFAEDENIKKVLFVNAGQYNSSGNFIIKYEQTTGGPIHYKDNLCEPEFNKSSGFLLNPKSDIINRLHRSCVYNIYPFGKSTEVTLFLTENMNSGNFLTVTQGITTNKVKQLPVKTDLYVKFPRDGANVKPVIIEYSTLKGDIAPFRVYVFQK